MSQPPPIIHLETPTEVPLTERFSVRGWIAGASPIEALAAGEGGALWLTLAERPDVRAAHPELPHVAGFSGEVSGEVIREGKLRLTWHVGGEVGAFAQALTVVRLPPDRLQVRQVGGVWGDNFYRSGSVMFDQIASACRDAGAPLEEARRILDFGCGCGRVLRSFPRLAPAGEVWGCDIDAEAIAWNRANLAAIARFDCNRELPPLAFSDGFFDVIYSVSVFTHLPEAMQLAWLAELRRVLRPGGLLLASVHGSRYWTVDPGVKAEVEQRGFAYRTGAVTEGLPEFYMTAFHAESYLRRRWSEFFEFVALKEAYIHGVHDAVILRRAS